MDACDSLLSSGARPTLRGHNKEHLAPDTDLTRHSRIRFVTPPNSFPTVGPDPYGDTPNPAPALSDAYHAEFLGVFTWVSNCDAASRAPTQPSIARAARPPQASAAYRPALIIGACQQKPHSNLQNAETNALSL